mmetsp:Transcript_96698/g.216627  ORF Transcript_96698/g.216627 Transcript_96698/m.216627 type:complete len:292 (-) Transcript_96698:76-951(-)
MLVARIAEGGCSADSWLPVTLEEFHDGHLRVDVVGYLSKMFRRRIIPRSAWPRVPATRNLHQDDIGTRCALRVHAIPDGVGKHLLRVALATIPIRPPLHRTQHRLMPVRWVAVSGKWVDRVGRAVYCDDRGRVRCVDRVREPQSAHGCNGRDEAGQFGGQARAEAPTSGKANTPDQLPVDVDPLHYVAEDLFGVGNVIGHPWQRQGVRANVEVLALAFQCSAREPGPVGERDHTKHLVCDLGCIPGSRCYEPERHWVLRRGSWWNVQDIAATSFNCNTLPCGIVEPACKTQ